MAHIESCRETETAIFAARTNLPVLDFLTWQVWSAPATAGKLLLPTKTRNVYANVVLPMKNDDVKSTVEMDPIIMAYGAWLH